MKVKIAVILLLSIILVSAAGYSEVKLKMAVVNPSSTDKQTTPIRYDLPKGIGPEQVIDIGTLDMKYDFDKGNYYVFGAVTLDPSEKKVIEITLKDVWSIPAADLNGLKSHTDTLVTRLKGTKHAASGGVLAGKINTQLDGILTKTGARDVSIKERINQYYEDMTILSETKNNIGMLENLVLDTGGIVEERVQVPTTLAIPLNEDNAQGGEDTIELKIRVTNPSLKAKQITPVRYALPAEITPRYIADRSGLDMGYDFNKQCFYLYKDDLELSPEETKEYIVKVKDVWKIADVELTVLKKHADNIMVLLKGGEFYNQGKLCADYINAAIDEITRTQAIKSSAVEHIAYYRDNTKSLQAAKEKAAELEKLVSQRGTSAGITVKWEGGGHEGGGEDVKKVKERQEERNYDLVVGRVAKSIFVGKAPTIATTWKVIFAIIIFMGVISAAFFTIWYVKSDKNMRK